MPERLILRNGGFIAELWPEYGGLLASYGADNGPEVFKTGGAGDFIGAFAGFGAPVMVPFANRLSEPFLPSTDGNIAMPVLWPEGGLPLHGTGFNVPWRAGDVREAGATLAADIPDADGRVIAVAEQRVSLAESGALTVRVVMRNVLGHGWPAGMGVHPWFDDDVAVRFRASHRFDGDERHLPCGVSEIGETAISVRGDDGYDCCHARWNGVAELTCARWPGAVRMVAENAPCLHVYASSAARTLCAEPVTHGPNAAHDPMVARLAPMTELGPGETIEMAMHLYPWTATCGDAA